MPKFAPAIGAEDEVLQEMASKLLPLLLLTSQIDAKDLEYAGWKWWLLIIEQHLGSERFEEVITKYVGKGGGGHG